MQAELTPRAAGISATAEIVAEIRSGRMVVILDAEERENEGDLVLAAEHVSSAAINFMARHGRGLICLALSQERCRLLELPLMPRSGESARRTNFTVSIDAARGITTGISAADRAATVRAAIRPGGSAADLVYPGHVFPLMAAAGGVLERAGHTEAACELAKLAGLAAAAVVCEIMKDDGEMARLPDLVKFAALHRLKVGTIADLIEHV